MKAIILAGGRGKRLRPVTDYVPKPLVSINNVPILEWQIRYLKKFNIDEIILCTGYKTEMIENYLKVKNNFGIKVTLSKEKLPLGTGGAIKQAIKKIREKTFFVLNGDIITDINITKLTKIPNSIAAIELRTKFGVIEAEGNIITKFMEKKEISDLWMNAGLYHLSRDVIEDLPNKGDIERTVFPNYAEKRNLTIVKFKNANWYSIDSFKDMEECSAEINKIIR